MQQSVQQALALAAANDGTNKLQLEFDGKVAERGETIENEKVKAPPTLKLAGEASGTYIAIAIDIDAPYGSVPLLSPIVHWIQPGFRPNNLGELGSDLPCVVEWLAPAPPPFSAPHRYIVVVYQQPANMDVAKWNSKFVKPVSIPSRIRWSLDDFARQAGLDNMIAANYFCN